MSFIQVDAINPGWNAIFWSTICYGQMFPSAEMYAQYLVCGFSAPLKTSLDNLWSLNQFCFVHTTLSCGGQGWSFLLFGCQVSSLEATRQGQHEEGLLVCDLSECHPKDRKGEYPAPFQCLCFFLKPGVSLGPRGLGVLQELGQGSSVNKKTLHTQLSNYT